MFDVPRPASSAAQPVDYIQPNLVHGLRIWWAFYWRTVLSSLVVATGVNLSLRRFSDDPTIAFVSRYDAYVLYYLAAFFAMAYILRKNFRLFRIGLLSNRGGDAKLLPPTLKRTARVWWTFCWRAVVYRLIATIAVMFPLGWTMGFLTAILPGALVTAAVQIILDAVVGMFVIYSSILDEDIADFRVTLLPKTASTSSHVTSPAPADLANG